MSRKAAFPKFQFICCIFTQICEKIKQDCALCFLWVCNQIIPKQWKSVLIPLNQNLCLYLLTYDSTVLMMNNFTNASEWWAKHGYLRQIFIHFDNRMSKIELLVWITNVLHQKIAKLFSIFLVLWLYFIQVSSYFQQSLKWYLCYLVIWSLFICPVFLILIFWIRLLIQVFNIFFCIKYTISTSLTLFRHYGTISIKQENLFEWIASSVLCIKGVLHLLPQKASKWTCFVLYLKIINIFLKNNVCLFIVNCPRNLKIASILR